ncbi:MULTISPECIES: hypothetical protein [unclassified Serratia (in: enterobacteria)]|uniref:hypothetical protein n=1 Tax=unclassified Serratia (in: enterobacteria) TaxID=2647522 RepID=UPI00046A5696|nr:MULTISPECIES: hypothetical protein [unclassified Serratia (in: enterobacteria)]
MLLSELTLIEASVVDINFAQKSLGSGDGMLKIEYGQLVFEGGGILSDDESKSTIKVTAKPSVVGGRDNFKKIDFSLKITMHMLYTYPRTVSLNESFLEENTWYFASLLRTHFKFFADDILKNTTISGVELPLN